MTKKTYVYDYPHPAVTVDIVVFTMINNDINILLIKRGEPPFKNCWALPGGFVRENETVEEAAKRELFEETSVSQCSPIQYGIYSEPDRDPRQRVISVAFYDCVRAEDLTIEAGTDAADVQWHPINLLKLDSLAFDHSRIVTDALMALKKSCRDTPVAAKMLPEFFKLTDLQETIEAIFGYPIDKRNFRRLMDEKQWLLKTEYFAKGTHRPASLYKLADP